MNTVAAAVLNTVAVAMRIPPLGADGQPMLTASQEAYANMRRRAEKAEDTLADLRHFHREWGNVDHDNLDVQALWEDMGALLGGAS